jgi:hypothetical protein
LIVIFRWQPQNYGYLDQLRVAIFLYVRVSKNFVFWSKITYELVARGIVRNI